MSIGENWNGWNQELELKRALWNVHQLKPEETSKTQREWLGFTILNFTLIKTKDGCKEIVKEYLFSSISSISFLNFIFHFIDQKKKKVCEVKYKKKKKIYLFIYDVLNQLLSHMEDMVWIQLILIWIC